MKSGSGTSGLGFSSSGVSPLMVLATLAAVPGTCIVDYSTRDKTMVFVKKGSVYKQHKIAHSLVHRNIAWSITYNRSFLKNKCIHHQLLQQLSK